MEAGRVALINYGDDAHKLVVIADVLDDHRVSPHSLYSRFLLTDQLLELREQSTPLPDSPSLTWDLRELREELDPELLLKPGKLKVSKLLGKRLHGLKNLPRDREDLNSTTSRDSKLWLPKDKDHSLWEKKPPVNPPKAKREERSEEVIKFF